jgi:mercuric ion transport protein
MADEDDKRDWTIFGSVGVAVAAAVCCLGPVVLVSLGVTGAWIGNLSALEPFRPLFMVVAAGLLGFGFYRAYGAASRRDDCGEDAACEIPAANRINRVSLWIATVVVAGLFASPYLLSLGLDDASARANTSPEHTATATTDDDAAEPDDSAALAAVTLDVEGMTCGGCARSIQATLRGLDGVEEASVTFEPPRARVSYDPSQVSVEALTQATADVGFASTEASTKPEPEETHE